LPTKLSPEISMKPLAILQTLDPRISEYVLQFPCVAKIAGQMPFTPVPNVLAPHVFLPFLLDCPGRTSAWEISTATRQLAYGLVNLVVPEIQRKMTVFEHKKQQDKSSGRELQLPSTSQIPEACQAILNLCSQLQEKLPKLCKAQIWTALAVHQDIEWSFAISKTPLSQQVVQQFASLEKNTNAKKDFTWDIVHFYAQLQGSYYSFRFLKQLLNVVFSNDSSNEFPKPVLLLYRELESLPKLSELSDLGHASSIISNLEGMFNVSHEEFGIGEQLMPEGAEKLSKADKKKRKRKRDQDVVGTPSGRSNPSNPFELLGME